MLCAATPRGLSADPERYGEPPLRRLTRVPTPTEFFHWYITDERTGKRRLTTYKLKRADAERQFPGAEPDLQTREVRMLPEPGELYGSCRPSGEASH